MSQAAPRPLTPAEEQQSRHMADAMALGFTGCSFHIMIGSLSILIFEAIVAASDTEEHARKNFEMILASQLDQLPTLWPKMKASQAEADKAWHELQGGRTQ